MKKYILFSLVLLLGISEKNYASCAQLTNPIILNDTTNDNPLSVAVSPAGSLIALANSGSNSVTLFTITNNQISGGNYYYPPSGATSPIAVAFSPDGNHLAVANKGSNNVTIFPVSGNTLRTGTNYPVASSDIGPYALAFSPDGKYLAVSNETDVILFNVNNGALSNARSSGTFENIFPSSVAFSPDSSLLALGGSYGGADVNVTILTISNGSFSKTSSYPLPTGSNNPEYVAFSPNGTLFATANTGSGDVSIFPVTGSTLGAGTSYSMPSGVRARTGIAFSPDNSALAVIGSTASIVLFDVVAGTLANSQPFYLPYSPGGTGNPVTLAFFPSGPSWLATANGYYNNISTGSVFVFTRCASAPTSAPNPSPSKSGSSIVSSTNALSLFFGLIGANILMQQPH